MLGVVGEQSQDHLQAAAPGAQQRDPGVGVDGAGGQLRGDGLAGRGGGGQRRAGAGDLLLQGGDAGVLGGGGDGRPASSPASSRSAAARVFSASRTAAFAWSRAGLRISLVFVSMLAR